MWDSWITAGHDEQKLANFINNLKVKHLEGSHNKDAGAGVRMGAFASEVVGQLQTICGEPSTWNTKKKEVNYKKKPQRNQKENKEPGSSSSESFDMVDEL